MENCRNIFNISARHGWSVSMETWIESGFSISGGRLRAVYRSALPLKPVTAQPAA